MSRKKEHSRSEGKVKKSLMESKWGVERGERREARKIDKRKLFHSSLDRIDPIGEF